MLATHEHKLVKYHKSQPAAAFTTPAFTFCNPLEPHNLRFDDTEVE